MTRWKTGEIALNGSFGCGQRDDRAVVTGILEHQDMFRSGGVPEGQLHRHLNRQAAIQTIADPVQITRRSWVPG